MAQKLSPTPCRHFNYAEAQLKLFGVDFHECFNTNRRPDQFKL